jgi:hypothetical protein
MESMVEDEVVEKIPETVVPLVFVAVVIMEVQYSIFVLVVLQP